jgi:hypothetical protein
LGPFLGLLREHLQLDLFGFAVEHARGLLAALKAEEASHTAAGCYASEPKYASLLQSARLLVSEVQDISYDMNVIKEWLASSSSPSPAALSTSSGGGAAVVADSGTAAGTNRAEAQAAPGVGNASTSGTNGTPPADTMDGTFAVPALLDAS